jgi:hypothetical protein
VAPIGSAVTSVSPERAAQRSAPGRAATGEADSGTSGRRSIPCPNFPAGNVRTVPRAWEATPAPLLVENQSKRANCERLRRSSGRNGWPNVLPMAVWPRQEARRRHEPAARGPGSREADDGTSRGREGRRARPGRPAGPASPLRPGVRPGQAPRACGLASIPASGPARPGPGPAARHGSAARHGPAAPRPGPGQAHITRSRHHPGRSRAGGARASRGAPTTSSGTRSRAMGSPRARRAGPRALRVSGAPHRRRSGPRTRS